METCDPGQHTLHTHSLVIMWQLWGSLTHLPFLFVIQTIGAEQNVSSLSALYKALGCSVCQRATKFSTEKLTVQFKVKLYRKLTPGVGMCWELQTSLIGKTQPHLTWVMGVHEYTLSSSWYHIHIFELLKVKCYFWAWNNEWFPNTYPIFHFKPNI